MALVLTLVEVASWNTSTTPKTMVVAGCVTGDYLFVLAGGDDNVGGGDTTAAAVTTTVGTTAAWIEDQKNLVSAAATNWVLLAHTNVTANGSVTVSVDRTQSATVGNWGAYVLKASGSTGIGNTAILTPATTAQVINFTVSTPGSAVALMLLDWNNGSVGTGWTPTTNVTAVEQAAETFYAANAAYWESQAVGNRDYGYTGGVVNAASNRGVIVEIVSPQSWTQSPIDDAGVSDTAATTTPWRMVRQAFIG